jgi:hypothetical protein
VRGLDGRHRKREASDPFRGKWRNCGGIEQVP